MQPRHVKSARAQPGSYCLPMLRGSHKMPLLSGLWGIGLTCFAIPALASPLPPSAAAIAQSPPPGTALPSERPGQIEELIPPPPENFQPLPVIPPAPPPSIPDLQPPPAETPESVPNSDLRFRVNRIEVIGSTVLQEEIAELVKEYEGQELSFEDLITLRSRITQQYVENGYITSGAFLPNNQNLSSGTVQIRVVEGVLEEISIEGLSRLQQSYVRSRLEAATQTPLNQRDLERGLQLLQLDPLLQQVNAELTAGSAPGRNILRLQLQEAPPLIAGLIVANNQAPSIGTLQGSAFVGYSNLLGWGDRITLEYGRTEGLNRYDIGYSVPINGMNGTLGFRYNRNGSEIVEARFRELGIRSESETFSFSLRQPLVRSPQTEFALGLNFDVRRSQTFILEDEPFSFSEGPEDGESRVSVLRFSQDWLNRDARRVLAARSQFSFGLDTFDATVNDTGVDGRFFAWIGQFQWVEQFSPRALMVARIDAQLTPDALLPLEQFSMGGTETVRGYPQNQLVSDNGVIGSLEFRFPITRNPQILQLIPFLEGGIGWNNNRPDPDPNLIASLGLGVRWQVIPDLTLRVDYGLPLLNGSDRGDFLEDGRFAFSLRYQPF